jgi:bacterioferritin (cytochrome b1)
MQVNNQKRVRININTDEGQEQILAKRHENRAIFEARQTRTTPCTLMGYPDSSILPEDTFSRSDATEQDDSQSIISEDFLEKDNSPESSRASLFRTATNRSHTSMNSSQSGARTESYIAEAMPAGEFRTYDDFKTARWKKRLAMFQLVAGATLGIVGIAFPPVLAAAGGVYAATDPAVWKGIGYVFSLGADLAGNPTALPNFKKKVKSAADSISTAVASMNDYFRENPRFKAHQVFLEKLATSLQNFAQKIQDQNLEECLAETLKFEEKTLEDLRNHLLNCETQKDKNTNRKNIYKVQEFLRKYDKYLNELPENLADLNNYNQIKLQDLVDRAGKSGIPELVEWSKNPKNLASNLAFLKVVNQNN